MKREALAERIRGLRSAHKKTQEEMAAVLGISRQAYIRLEKGTREISFVEIAAIANFLGIPYTDITDVGESYDLSLVALCRKEQCSADDEKAFATVEEILGVFSAQERLYNRVREKKDEERDG